MRSVTTPARRPYSQIDSCVNCRKQAYFQMFLLSIACVSAGVHRSDKLQSDASSVRFSESTAKWDTGSILIFIGKGASLRIG